MACSRCGVAAHTRRFIGMLIACCFIAGACALTGCTAKATIDESSPQFGSVSIAAGSELTEVSQYVEVRLSFDEVLEASGDVAGDVRVLLNGEEPNAQTVSCQVYVEGNDVVVRLSPAAGAGETSTGVYFALYDGLVSVAAAADDGGLPHVKIAGGSSNAVITEQVSFTVPSGVEIGAIEAVAAADASDGLASVSFDVTRFAQLRCCTWIAFGDGAPIVMMHNHEFARDTEKTCAQRLVETINTNYGDSLSAECDGARVTVRAVDASIASLSPVLIQGAGANPAQGEQGTGEFEVLASVFDGAAA